MATRTASRTLTAFLDGPDDPSIPNPIHSTEGAAKHGFAAPLVGGVTVYGWAAPTILELLGDGWLNYGWADISFRRPVFPGDALTVEVQGDAGQAAVSVTKAGGEVAIRGEAGLGRAPWLAELAMPARLAAEPPPEQRLPLTPATIEAGHDLRPMAVTFTVEAVAAYARDLQRDDSPLWCGPEPRIHPAQLAARMTPLLMNSFRYGPAIHARSQIQHLERADAGQEVTVAGRIVEAFERNGHQYAVVDGAIIGEQGWILARIRHTTIYQLATAVGG